MGEMQAGQFEGQKIPFAGLNSNLNLNGLI